MKERTDKDTLSVSEIVKTIHGELPHQGRPTVLVRLAGCTNACSWCDAPEHRQDTGTAMSIADIKNEIASKGLRDVLLTGGEPMEQKAAVALLKELLSDGLEVTLETDGSFDISKLPKKATVVMDIKTPSARSKRRSLPSNLNYLKKQDIAKFVIGDRSDYEWSKGFLKDHAGSLKAQVVFSCVSEKFSPKEMARLLIEDNSSYRMQLQIHKTLEMK